MSAPAENVLAFPRSLHADLLDGLRDLVNRGDLAPGARVPERALCERFGVSRTPLREALKVLAAEGLVDLLPNRGARIATLADDHLMHLFEVIAALEAEGGRLACQRITDDALAEIQGLHYRMYAHFLRQELPEYFALNQAIHHAILTAAGNPVLLATYGSLGRGDHPGTLHGEPDAPRSLGNGDGRARRQSSMRWCTATGRRSARCWRATWKTSATSSWKRSASRADARAAAEIEAGRLRNGW